MLNHIIEVEHVYQDPDNPSIQTIIHKGDGPSLLWLFRALVDENKNFTIRIHSDLHTKHEGQ